MAAMAAAQPAPSPKPWVLPVSKRDWLRPLNVGIEIETCLVNNFKPLPDPFAPSDEEDKEDEEDDFYSDDEYDDEEVLEFDEQERRHRNLTQFKRSLNFFEQTTDSSLVGWNPDYEDWEPRIKARTSGVEFIQCFDKARCAKCIKRTGHSLFKQVFPVRTPQTTLRGTNVASLSAAKSFEIGNAMICKKCSAHFNIPIWDEFPVQPQKFFEPNMQANILREIRTIWSNSRQCELNDDGNESAGLHVHMSHPIMNIHKYPLFGDFIMRHWRTKLQDKMIRKWNLRTDNEYCEPNRQRHDSGFCTYKYLMMNIINTFRRGETLWHVEFRGFQALNPNAPGAVLELQEYIEDLGSLFAGACELFLAQPKQNTEPFWNIFGKENKELLLRVPRSQRIIWSMPRGGREEEEEWVSSDDEEEESAAGGRKKRQRLKLVDLFPNLRF